MKTSIILSLEKRRVKSDGTMMIVYRITHNRLTSVIPSGIRVTPQGWDEKKRKIRTSYKGLENVTRINNMLEKTKAGYIDTITVLHEQNKLNFLSVMELKAKLVNHVANDSVFAFTKSVIAEQKKQNRIGNARSYENVLRELMVFRKKRDFNFNELNYHFLLKFETYYLEKGNSINGLAVYMRTIRAIYNKAIKENIASADGYPFKNYTIKSEPTKKRAISMDSIQKIVALKYDPNDARFRTRNIFLMSFYLMGAPYTDLAHLKVSNIVDGRIQYKRQKTGKFYDIKITENLEEIISYYTLGKNKDEYILPIITHEEIEKQYNDVLNKRKRYNKQLKRIAEDAGIEEHLTSYVSRHSFASIANNMAVPVTAISEMLGHQKISTTQTYLASLNKEVIDDYNAKIIGGEAAKS